MKPEHLLNSSSSGLEAAVLAVATAIANAGVNAVWIPWTPTVTAGSGSFTAVSGSGRYIQIGRTVFFKCDITITTIGTGSGCSFTLPIAAQTTTGHIGSAREDATTGNAGTIKLNSSAVSATVIRYDNGNITSGGSGSLIRCSGMYEAAN